MKISEELYKRLMPRATYVNIHKYGEHLNYTLSEFNIISPLRVAAFIAQIAHESANLLYVEELASGRAYEGRKDLGNIYPGDGKRYKGRGLIQLTGRANYAKAMEYFEVDFIEYPAMLAEPVYACRVSGLFWAEHGCNKLADKGAFDSITKTINGGYNGKAERDENYRRCKHVLGLT